MSNIQNKRIEETTNVKHSSSSEAQGIYQKSETNNSARILTKEDAILIANLYMREHYLQDNLIENINEPTNVFFNGKGWTIYYKDKELSRFPAGVEIFVNQTTGKCFRINQE